MAKNNIFYMFVEDDEYELPCSPPYDRICDIAKIYNMKPGSVSKAVARESKTQFGKIIKIERNIETMEDQLELRIEELEDQVSDLEMRIDEALSDIRVLNKDIGRDRHGSCHVASVLSHLSRITDDLNGEISYENYMEAIS